MAGVACSVVDPGKTMCKRYKNKTRTQQGSAHAPHAPAHVCSSVGEAAAHNEERRCWRRRGQAREWGSVHGQKSNSERGRGALQRRGSVERSSRCALGANTRCCRRCRCRVCVRALVLALAGVRA
eukprot:351317-Chlamydomonas_euryale.AAC.1